MHAGPLILPDSESWRCKNAWLLNAAFHTFVSILFVFRDASECTMYRIYIVGVGIRIHIGVGIRIHIGVGITQIKKEKKKKGGRGGGQLHTDGIGGFKHFKKPKKLRGM